MSSTHVRNVYYTPEQLKSLDKSRIPKHVAVIPDGNRRWAKKHHVSAFQGHQKGADILMDIVKASKELGIKVVTFYIFSTENWTRNDEEVKAVLWLLETYVTEQCQTMLAHGIRLQTIGDLARLPDSVKQALQATKDATAECHDIEMVFAVNYGGRDEIRRAMQAILDDYADQKIKREEVTERLISRYLDTNRWSDPDLLIRTSGEFRFSNFLIWQTSYTETYIADILWPDFNPTNLLEAVFSFQKRERRLGGT